MHTGCSELRKESFIGIGTVYYFILDTAIVGLIVPLFGGEKSHKRDEARIKVFVKCQN